MGRARLGLPRPGGWPMAHGRCSVSLGAMPAGLDQGPAQPTWYCYLSQQANDESFDTTRGICRRGNHPPIGHVHWKFLFVTGYGPLATVKHVANDPFSTSEKLKTITLKFMKSYFSFTNFTTRLHWTFNFWHASENLVLCVVYFIEIV